MIDATKRYTALILGIAGCALILSFAAGSMVSARGVAGPTIGVSLQPVQATLTLAVCLGLAFIVAVVVGRVVNAAVAAFTLGAGLAALSMRTGTHLDLLFAGAATMPVAIETLAWGVVVLLVAAGLMRLTGPLPDQPWNDARTSTMPAMVFAPDALRAALAGALAVVVVWAVAANDLKLQAIAAATVAGVATGVGGRMLAPRVQPVLLFAAPVVFMAGGQVFAGLSGGDSIAAWASGGASGLGIPTPLDAAAGALMGVAMGIGWSRGHVEEHAD